MTLDKIQHYLTHIFLLILVILQGVVFVAAKATNSPALQAVFLSPNPNQSITIGNVINLKAQLIIEDSDFSIIYFKIANSQANLNLHFEAQEQSDGSWASLASWDTAGFVSGYYDLSAIAYFYDNSGQLTKNLVSNIQSVYLAYPVEMSQIDEDDQLPTIPDQEPEKETPTALSASIISPNLETVSSTIDLVIEFNDTLLDSQAVSAYLIFGTSTITTLDLESLDNIEYSASLDTADYQNGDYSLIFYVDNDEIISTALTIDNPVLPEIVLLSPTDNTITSNALTINVSTNFLADNLTLEFINSADPAISTGELSISRTDGYTWAQTINLGSSFVDGAYTLIAKSGEIEASFDFTLDLVDETMGWPNSPSEIVLDLYTLGPNLSGTVLAQASSSFSGLAVDFVAKDSITQAPVGRFESVYFGNMYGANIDTLTLPNGNYYLSAETVFQDTIVSSNSILVSVFNPSQDLETSTTTPSSTPVISEAEPVVFESPTVLENSDFLFSRQTTCLAAGLNSQNACLYFRGIVDGLLDQGCIAQNILDPMACEDYLNLVYVANDCQAASIIDREQCKDYLLEKYVGAVDCQLADQALCHDVLRNTYLNRLVLDMKKQADIDQGLSAVVGQNMSIESIKNTLPEAELAIGQGEILLVKSRNEVFLGSDYSLTVANGQVIALDTDRDGLIDDLENYYGTDPNQVDSDNDGYIDSVEIQNNYNPLGGGVLEKTRTDLDLAILSGADIRQPKLTADNIDNRLQIMTVDNLDNKIKLGGVALPNTLVNIFIYSDLPLLATVETDESGNWSYTAPQNLSDGHHRVYLALNDADGKITSQSVPLSLFVKSAHAVTAEEFFGADTNAQVEIADWSMYYMIGGGVLLIILVIIISYLFVHRSKNLYNPL